MGETDFEKGEKVAWSYMGKDVPGVLKVRCDACMRSITCTFGHGVRDAALRAVEAWREAPFTRAAYH
jgi:hypothetical protein